MAPLSRRIMNEGLAGDMRCLFVTFAIALASGWVCLQLGIPAPYLMGSLFGVWFGGALLKPLRPHLGVGGVEGFSPRLGHGEVAQDGV